ncbi:hypothetical protein SanaruYs_39490 [Chryseotalea sanaruensis]|uniref:Uncharacterized protein n=1 Tax=Chryseotalea sanaruensis TaxID=2482724 RepID=A0A401UFS3_9BACT|nr:hypothetical protein [Chryseotalea sanaruensis]GCC53704.1 hypothetical protein SanaruYs_39490 [Chryseotalea sanaruensis]
MTVTVDIVNDFLNDLERVKGRGHFAIEPYIPIDKKYLIKNEDILICLESLVSQGFIRLDRKTSSYPNGTFGIEPKGSSVVGKGGFTEEEFTNILKPMQDNSAKKLLKTEQTFNIGQVNNLNSGDILGTLNQSSSDKSVNKRETTSGVSHKGFEKNQRDFIGYAIGIVSIIVAIILWLLG